MLRTPWGCPSAGEETDGCMYLNMADSDQWALRIMNVYLLPQANVYACFIPTLNDSDWEKAICLTENLAPIKLHSLPQLQLAMWRWKMLRTRSANHHVEGPARPGGSTADSHDSSRPKQLTPARERGRSGPTIWHSKRTCPPSDFALLD